MIYLVLSLLSSSLITIVMRYSQNRINGEISMLSANYLTCTLLSIFYIGFSNIIPTGDKATLTLYLGILDGILYVVSLVLSQYNIKKNGVVLPSIFSRIGGLLIPMIFAICFFSEIPDIFQIIGSLIAMGAIIFINYSKESNANKSMFFLFLLFFIEGIGSVMSKIYEQYGSTNLSDHFLLYTFIVALILTIIMVIYRKEKPGIKELLFGIGIGVPNFYSSRFILMALNSVPTIIAYPVKSVGSMVCVSLAGIFLFKEKLSKKQWYAFIAIIIAIALLNI